MSISNSIYRFFILWYICGVVLLTFDLLPPWLEWANSVFLYVSGSLAFLYLVKAYNYRLASLLSLIVIAATIFAEWLGVTYGFLFGSYHYEKDFGVQIMGVPLTIGFAWLMVVVTSRVLTLQVMNNIRIPKWGRLFAYATITSLFAVVMDLAIDPVAYVVKQYWVWEAESMYYNIPFSNFMGWFVLSFFIQIFFYLILKGQDKRDVPLWEHRMVVLYILVVGMFLLIALTAQLWLCFIVTTLSLFVLLLLYWRGKLHAIPKEK
ncbi:carotenoid biosynthesis protein [Metabacillus iocasae]|uniref:Membrane protein n=1 Tax=Priestia iocasae TaxID=2291674 RepID=A0ABS2QZE7_9BACI|nr:carotenoid biosynthesis protein [Metabacillus iocasae]MBM7703819.1 putative membrane protein [Metabacillus iocasae]